MQIAVVEIDNHFPIRPGDSRRACVPFIGHDPVEGSRPARYLMDYETRQLPL